MFFCEICDTFKNTYFEELLLTTASRDSVLESLQYFCVTWKSTRLKETVPWSKAFHKFPYSLQVGSFPSFSDLNYYILLLIYRILSKFHSKLLPLSGSCISTVKSVRIRSFPVRIFPHPDWKRIDTEYLSVFSPNAGKYGKEKLRIRTLFTQCSSLLLPFYDEIFTTQKMKFSIKAFLSKCYRIRSKLDVF